MSSVLEQGIDKMERAVEALGPDATTAPELLLQLHGLRRVQAATATLKTVASAPSWMPQMLPIIPTDACPALFQGLVELVQGLAECKASSGSTTLADGLDTLLFEEGKGLVSLMVSTSPATGMTLSLIDPPEICTPLAAVAAIAAFIVAGDSDDAQRLRCSWHTLHSVLTVVWPDTGSAARKRALERDHWVPAPPSAAPAGARAEVAPAPAPGTLAAKLAADLERHVPGVSLADLKHAALTSMACNFCSKLTLTPLQMQQLLVRVQDVPAGRATGCFQLARVWQIAGRSSAITAPRLERLAAYLDCAQEVAAASECEWLGALKGHGCCSWRSRRERAFLVANPQPTTQLQATTAPLRLPRWRPPCACSYSSCGAAPRCARCLRGRQSASSSAATRRWPARPTACRT